MNKYAIGIDLGGTNIRIALLDQKLNIIKKEEIRTQSTKDLIDFINSVKLMINNADKGNESEIIGFVFPAPYTSGQTYISDITNVPFLECVKTTQLREAFPERRIYFENDVNVVALLESDCGAARNVENSVYVTVSTGIGCGIIINNKIYHGANGYAGEIGSIIISDSAEYSDDPTGGSFEQLCSGKALDEKSRMLYGNNASSKDLFREYDNDSEAAVIIVNKWLNNMTRGLVAVIQTVDPEVIVMGGSVILNNDWIIQKLQDNVANIVLGKLSHKIKIVKSEYGPDAGVIGAGYYAFKTEGE